MRKFGDSGCRYLLCVLWQCGRRVRRRGASYCKEHHARCYIARGSRAEAAKLVQVETCVAWLDRKLEAEAAARSARSAAMPD